VPEPGEVVPERCGDAATLLHPTMGMSAAPRTDRAWAGAGASDDAAADEDASARHDAGADEDAMPRLDWSG
jgi:hypothetical protein